MISLPSELEPSSLLCCDELTRNAQMARESCQDVRKDIRQGHACELLEQVARDVEGLDDQGDRLGCAVGLLHLADACRAADKLGPALRHSERARQLFLRQAAREQRINQAAATYSVGLLKHLLGEDKEALEWYAQAADLFTEAREHWAIVGDRKQVERCDVIIGWIEELIKCLRNGRRPGGVSADPFITLLCPWFADEGRVGYLLLDLRYEIARARIDDRPFDVLPPGGGGPPGGAPPPPPGGGPPGGAPPPPPPGGGGPPGGAPPPPPPGGGGPPAGAPPVPPPGGGGTSVITLNPGEDYFVVPIPEEERQRLGAQGSDYALVRQRDGDGEGDGVLIDEEGNVVWGRFVRDQDGRIDFVPPYTKEPRLIGNIVALLRPRQE
jgi:hypothetical protein